MVVRLKSTEMFNRLLSKTELFLINNLLPTTIFLELLYFHLGPSNF